MLFTGFGDGTFRFLRDLERHNDKAWFQDHRSVYEEEVLEPGMAFIEAIGPVLAKFSPRVRAEPKVGGSMMRINRDIRFSKDKRPYKNHLDMMFRVGPAKTSPGYWFRLRSNELILGAGMHTLDRPELERYRKAVDADGPGAELATIITKEQRAGYDVAGEHYKRVPAGFAPDHPREALLRHAGIYVGTDMEIPAEARTPRFPAFCAAHYKKMAPMIVWLSANVA
ncbi:MAG TPA: DUF2461 domain-containing protein [Actinomycetota bacterium]|nr:DUF2461 domain-containing protein [Actinomycetota bacterium]